ncbi:cyclic nucleotide-binding domain-containing protein [Limibacillus sp. MBR-115]|jgi:CRP-like cAMP-binding protein|uniref:cyclic nucleotide-binding domain-containing protein n=1 Tax=Limibacillus sp. MBR-115 TaxID=3156465 RepID=UPI00339B941A
MLKRVTFEPGAVLCREGEPADVAYFLERGEVDLTAFGDTHKIFSGDVCGEAALLGSSYHATAVAVSEVEALSASREDLLQIIYTDPQKAELFFDCVIRKVAALYRTLDRLKNEQAQPAAQEDRLVG